MRKFTFDQALLKTEAKNAAEESVYEMYYSYQEPVRKLPPHRVLAINRGEREEVLRVAFDVPADRIHEHIQRKLLRSGTAQSVRDILVAVIEDCL